MAWNGGRRRPDGLTAAIERGERIYAARVALAAEREASKPAITPATHIEASWCAHGWACPCKSPGSDPREG